ncbi:hypothetical protein CAEBREN_02675 [Caenorhabditis brenneri]|uniref:F-box associated domain-containing protein n=1 Tax=Caenorhabditis brenneri TaxID=135651 RepID=G0P1X2_CAEBE|nr:hypothetical protein CAEBREN_02675 [Caenorhabditis brenneri]
MTINFLRLPLLVKEVVSKQVDWNEFDLANLILELMKSRKLKYCVTLSKTRISIDSIKFTLSNKNLEIKMKKGNKELTIRGSSLAIPPERWLYQSNTFWIHRINYIERPEQNDNHLWQPWCPGPENVINVKKEEGEMETIRRIMDYLNPCLIFKNTSVTIEESEFVNAFFSWNKIQKFEELTISKGSSRDQTTGEPLAINVTSGTLLKILEELEVQNLNLCVQVIDAPDFHYQFSPDKNYKFKKTDIEWAGWLDVDSLTNLKIEKMELNIANGFDQKAIFLLNHWLDGNDETLKELNLTCTGGQNWIRDTIVEGVARNDNRFPGLTKNQLMDQLTSDGEFQISRPDRSQADVTLDYNSLRMIVRPLPMFPMLLNPIRVPHDGPFGPPVGVLVGPFGGRLVYQQLFRFQ